jgi:hypothetical protein
MTLPEPERSVSDWLRTRSVKSVEYNERLADVYDALWSCEFATVAALRDTGLGGTSAEVTAKLRELQRMGLVYYDAPEWHVETE